MKTRPVASALIWFIAGSACSEYIGIGIGELNSWFGREFGSAPVMKIDLQAKKGCPSGSLSDLRKQFSDGRLWLERGADSMTICADVAIYTTVDDAPRRLAREFPGCLNYTTGSLKMLRASHAVCALPDGRGYICDGAQGSGIQPPDALGVQASAVQSCTSNTLAEFGFVAG